MEASANSSAPAVDLADAPAIKKPVPQASGNSSSSKRWLVVFGLVAIAGIGTFAAAVLSHHKGASAASTGKHESEEPQSAAQSGLPVESVHPRKGGLVRTTEQSGSAHAFESAELFAKVSGYLKSQSVDIGDTVKRDQLLAEIDAPELDKAVDQMKAALDTANARVHIAQARIKSAEAEVKSAQALVTQAQVNVTTQEANVALRSKQLVRIQGLVKREAIEQKLEDEEIDKFEAAKSTERFARAAVISAEAAERAKQADLDQARADVEEAKANVEVAQANLGKAQVFANYTKITSPYDGVITHRTYHRGDFIRSAETGDAQMVLAVARTDKMRIVLPVPDRDVPYVDRGDPAVVRLDALRGEEFRGTVSRFASTEDPSSRNMRTEVDLENPTGRIKEGMYGRVTITLRPATPESVTIPSAALLGQDQKGVGTVFVARDGKAKKISVNVGMDNGVEAEIVSGLTLADLVITKYNGALADGTPVVTDTK